MRWLFDFFGESDRIEVKPVKPPKLFSIPVGQGYCDDEGKWHTSKEKADYTSALRHITSEGAKCYTSVGSFTTFFDKFKFIEKLEEPDTIAAMAILGKGKP